MMSERREKTYRPWEPERYRQDAQSPTAKLPEGDLVFFLLDTVPQLESDTPRRAGGLMSRAASKAAGCHLPTQTA